MIRSHVNNYIFLNLLKMSKFLEPPYLILSSLLIDNSYSYIEKHVDGFKKDTFSSRPDTFQQSKINLFQR